MVGSARAKRIDGGDSDGFSLNGTPAYGGKRYQIENVRGMPFSTDGERLAVAVGIAVAPKRDVSSQAVRP